MNKEVENASSQFLRTDRTKAKSNAIEIPAISLPKGGGAIKGIDEKFSVNAVNGTASFSIPLPFSPARTASPALSLSYNSGAGNGVFGLGWNLSLPSIKRTTGKQLPQYSDAIDSDTFLFSEAEDLVPEFKKETDGSFSKDADGNYVIREKDAANGLFTIRYYKPRIEGLFARIERWRHKTTGEMKWRIITKENVTTLFGWGAASRISDPTDANKIFEWLPEFVFDDKGNCAYYSYKKEDDKGLNTSLLHNRNRTQNGDLTYTNLYLEKVLYGNKTPYKNFTDARPAETDYLLQTVFDYGEYDTAPPYSKIKDWNFRTDTYSDYKAGFEIRTTRLCKRVLLFHHFTELPGGSALVKSLNLGYDASVHEDFTFLKSITSYGYIKQTDGTYTYKSMPPMEFEYQQHDWSKEIKSVIQGDTVQMPVGPDEPLYQFTDLFNEGLAGILSEQSGSWYYKRNLGGGEFEQAKPVNPKPSFAGSGGKLQLTDLDADGGKQFVSYGNDPKGYFELNDASEWQGMRLFKSLPNIDFSSPNTKMLDLDGDGRPELVISEEKVFTWYPSEGRNGFGQANKAFKSLNEEEGPHIVFADSKQSIFLADMSGDGMTDIVRIRNGEVCYWPNLGYGKFGPKLSLDNAPVFDHPGAFNPAYLRLADLDGSGTSDIIYLGKNKFSCWKNLSGNRLSPIPFEIEHVAGIDSRMKISVTDLLGNGMACIVWSGSLSKHGTAPLKYIDLANGKKPYIMVAYKNNLGKQVSLEYTPSTHFYLEDKKAGKPWVTKLHFPIHCISKTITEDKICGYKFVTEYRYHHGYYDHAEREFRGFGMIEQIDAESFEHWQKGNGANIVEEQLHQEPVVTKNWYHTGAFLQKEKILDQFAKDYWYEQMPLQGFTVSHHESALADAKLTAAPGMYASILNRLSAQEWREAFRACKGMELRSEVFAKDAKQFGDTYEARKKELTPFSVATHNGVIELLQPKGKNKHAIFALNKRETRTYNYERNAEDPRIAHTLNIKLDEYGNVLESAAIVYPRIQADESLPGPTQQAQAKTTIIYTQNSYTNDVIDDNEYRLRVAAETKNCELKGVATTAAYYSVTDFENILSASAEIAYHQAGTNPAPGTAQKRWIEHTRNIFYKNDLSGALPLNQLESKGIPFETYQLAYNPGLLTDIFDARVNADLLTEGKFTNSEGDNNWWRRSGGNQFITAIETVADAQLRFYTPVAYTDSFGAVTKTKYYSNYFLFIEETEDAFGNKAKVDLFNFRTLSPQRMRDINNNISEAITDEMGLVKAMAVFGKGDEADKLTGINEFTTEAEQTQIASFFDATDAVQLTELGKTLVHTATARFVYDFDAYKDSGKPASVASIVREAHFQNNHHSPVQLSFEYSNGLGKVVMTKAQAAPGLVKQVVVNPDNTFTTTTTDTAANKTRQIRWIGTGRTVLNNKGNTVKQYEPYFSLTHAYEDLKELVETGSTPKLYYDAAGRLIKTGMPDGTFSKISFDSWKQSSYDANDTILDSAWYSNRTRRLIDEQLIAEGKDPAREKQAADKAAKHANTPNIQHFDTMGRAVLSAEHNKQTTTGDNEFYHTNIILDAEGNLTAVTDAGGNMIAQYKYDMLGNMVYQNNLAAGQRWLLNNILDAPLRTWDERDHEFQYFYDILHRPLRSVVVNNVGKPGDQLLNNVFDRVIYGEDLLLADGSNLPELQARNVLGKPIQHYDTGGLMDTPDYDFKEQALTTTRRLFRKYKEVTNWIDDNLLADLEAEAYTFITETDALGRIAKQIAPDGSIITHSYNEAGLLNSQRVAHANAGTATTYIKEIDYNEKGQRNKIIYGNNVITRFYYDKETFRLKRLESKRQNNDPLQDWYYTYDPVGNITHIEDKNITDTFFHNKKISGVSAYTYDALYRLTAATGRENNALPASGRHDNWNDAAFMQAINPGDPMQMRNYTQRYQYDSVGNILEMRHRAAGNNWTRTYQYQAGNNRLVSTQVGSETFHYPHHAQHGFITAMPHLEDMGWNFREELIKTIRQKRNEGGTPETTYYQYDKQGQRIRKITENQAGPGNAPTKKEERIYVTGYELYKKYSGPHAGLERTSLSLMDEAHRFVMIETRNDVDDGTEKQLVRYQLHNHLGSASLELDNTAQVISYEEYHPYGTTAYQAKNSAIKSAAKRYRYTGMERDEESGLEYHRARYYVPWLGRWLSCDPLYKEDKVLSQNSKAGNDKGNNTGEKSSQYNDNENPEAFGQPYQYPNEDYSLEKSNGQWRKPQRQLNPISAHEHSLPGKEDLSDLKNLNLYAYAALDPIVYQDPTGNVPILQAWWDGYSNAGTAGKVGYGILFIFAWLAHVIVNLIVLIFSVFVQNLLAFWDFSWGAPQSLIGLGAGIILTLLGADVMPKWGMGAKIELPAYMGNPGGISFGPVIIGGHGFTDWAHESGHTWQSRVLGPLYLFIIGIPSLGSAASNPSNHNNFFTEKWADAWAT